MKYVADKDRKAFAADLKKIYHAPNADRAAEIRDTVAEKWSEKYPNAMKSWTTNWDAIIPIFKFSSDVRTVIYTTYTDKKPIPMFFRNPAITGIS